MVLYYRQMSRAHATTRALDWLRRHDPRLAALRRATRAAVVMPAMFALADEGIGNPLVATFAALGCFAMLLLVDFPGSMRARFQAQASLAVATGALVCLGTLVSRSTPLAAVTMGLVGFAVLFSGVVSSVLAGAGPALLLSFILSVTLPAQPAAIPDRLAGWGIAAAASLIAIELLWPAPARDPLRSAAIATCRALAARLAFEVDYVIAGRPAGMDEQHAATVAAAEGAVEQLRATFFATPYRPTGLSTAARAVVRLVDECNWLNAIVVQTSPARHTGESARAVCPVKRAAAQALARAAELLEDPGRSPQELEGALAQLHERLQELEESAIERLPAAIEPGAAVSALDPSFRAQELSFVVARIARNAGLAAAADRRSWPAQLLGRQPHGIGGPLASAQERAGAHVERHSLSLHNSLRGAAGLALAVLVADLTGVEHAFWVVLGTLAVLRSNALSTGQNALRGLLGTSAGFVVGALLVLAIGSERDVLWGLLPAAVLLAGFAPAAVSFAAGQAAFTVVLLILFNILAPAGWRIGLVRIEDVALGFGISLLVGLTLWPRGAGAALGEALADAYRSSVRYLDAAVQFALGRCDALSTPCGPPIEEAALAAAAARRLDDTFRGYLGERGAKPVPLAEIATLLSGVAGLRLAGDAVLDLWDDEAPASDERAAARGALGATSERLSDWYGRFAASLAGEGEVPDPLAFDGDGALRLAETVGSDLRDGHAAATGVRVIWTGDHLDAARRLQIALADNARTAVQRHALDSDSLLQGALGATPSR